MELLNDPHLGRTAPGSREHYENQKIMIKARPLIHRCYSEWYSRMQSDLMTVPEGGEGIVVELGSGGSFLKEYISGLTTSDVVPGIADKVIDARDLPFPNSSVRGIFLTHCFHHIPDVDRFLFEADRVLIQGGIIAMVEVAATPFARFFFSNFHPEPFDPGVREWSFDSEVNTDANQALSWIVFRRDLSWFQRRHPNLRLEATNWLPWFSYILSGGVTRRNLVPRFLVPLITGMDFLLKPLDSLASLHWYIRLRKR